MIIRDFCDGDNNDYNTNNKNNDTNIHPPAEREESLRNTIAELDFHVMTPSVLPPSEGCQVKRSATIVIISIIIIIAIVLLLLLL